MPFVAARRCAPTNAIGIFPAELLRPVANALVADINAAGSEHFLDHPQAERKSEIEPNRVRNHLGGKAMPAIERITNLFHAPPLPANRPCLVKLAVPPNWHAAFIMAEGDAVPESALYLVVQITA